MPTLLSLALRCGALRPRLLAALLSILSLGAYAEPGIQALADDWIRANGTADASARESLIDRIVSRDYAAGDMTGAVSGDRDAFKRYLAGAHAAFARYRLTLRQRAIDGDRVWMVLEASGQTRPGSPGEPAKDIAVSLVVILRVAHGKIVREWLLTDVAGLNAQLSG